MAIQTYPQVITFTFESVSVSVGLNDYACYTATIPSGGFTVNDPSSSITYFGNVISVEVLQLSTVVKVLFNGLYDDSDQDPAWVFPDPPTNYLITLPVPFQDFIIFVKDNVVNTSSLIGYFAEAEFINYSNTPAELFSVGSEVVESSK